MSSLAWCCWKQFIVANQCEHACAVCPWPALARAEIHANQSLLRRRVVAGGDINLPIKRTLQMHIRVALTALANAGQANVFVFVVASLFAAEAQCPKDLIGNNNHLGIHHLCTISKRKAQIRLLKRNTSRGKGSVRRQHAEYA